MNDQSAEQPIELKDALDRLAEARLLLGEADAAWDEVQALVNSEYGHIDKKRRELKKAEEEAYAVACEAAKREFQDTGAFVPDDDVTMKASYVAVYDPTAALDWCIDHDRSDLLSLNVKAFEKAVREGHVSPEVAHVDIQFKPYISQKLSHRLLVDEE